MAHRRRLRRDEPIVRFTSYVCNDDYVIDPGKSKVYLAPPKGDITITCGEAIVGTIPAGLINGASARALGR